MDRIKEIEDVLVKMSGEFITTRTFLDFFEVLTELLKEVRDTSTANVDEFKATTDKLVSDRITELYTNNQAQWDKILSRVSEIRNGEDYVLTDKDRADIAGLITVPVVEKIIEKTEVIREQPIYNETVKVTNEIKEVAVSDTSEDIRNKLELLTGDERLDKSAIRGLEGVVDQEGLDRAIGILDKRTQFLINKPSTSSSGAEWGGISGTLSAQTDLQAALDQKATKSFAVAMAVAL